MAMGVLGWAMPSTGSGGIEEGNRLDDAFALLGNETRMAILQELWNQRERIAEEVDNAIPFTELRERVGMEDPGQFNYHVNQLVDDFVRRTDSGYVLRKNAVQVLRAAVVRSETRDLELPTTEAEDSCPFCGAIVEVSYENELLVVRCTECPQEHVSEILAGGTLMNSPIFPPTGIADRGGQDLWEARFDHVASAAFGILRDVCPVCAARPTVSVDACVDHGPDTICERCGSTQAVMATVRCETCTFAWRGPAWVAAMTHPQVIAFFDEHGVDADGGLTLDVYRELLPSEQTVHSTEPLRAEIIVELDGDALTVTMGDELNVVSVAEHDAAETV